MTEQVDGLLVSRSGPRRLTLTVRGTFVKGGQALAVSAVPWHVVRSRHNPRLTEQEMPPETEDPLILVTGSTGKVGQHFLGRLLADPA